MNSTKDNKKEEIKNKKNTIPQKTNPPPKENKDNFKRPLHQRWPYMTRFHHSFNGYCLLCNNFGHKARDCRKRARKFGWIRISYGFPSRNYNSCAPLVDYDVICYKCNNLGHIAQFCRNGFVKPPRKSKKVDALPKQKKEPTKFWKRQKDPEK